MGWNRTEGDGRKGREGEKLKVSRELKVSQGRQVERNQTESEEKWDGMDEDREKWHDGWMKIERS